MTAAGADLLPAATTRGVEHLQLHKKNQSTRDFLNGFEEAQWTLQPVDEKPEKAQQIEQQGAAWRDAGQAAMQQAPEPLPTGPTHNETDAEQQQANKNVGEFFKTVVTAGIGGTGALGHAAHVGIDTVEAVHSVNEGDRETRAKAVAQTAQPGPVNLEALFSGMEPRAKGNEWWAGVPGQRQLELQERANARPLNTVTHQRSPSARDAARNRQPDRLQMAGAGASWSPTAPSESSSWA